MNSFEDKISYKRLLYIVKINKGKNAFNGEIYIRDIYTRILGMPWKNIRKFWSIWTKILGNLEMCNSQLVNDKFDSY